MKKLLSLVALLGLLLPAGSAEASRYLPDPTAAVLQPPAPGLAELEAAERQAERHQLAEALQERAAS